VSNLLYNQDLQLERFAEFLLKKQLAPEAKARFYVHWVRKFLGQGISVPVASLDDRIAGFLKSMEFGEEKGIMKTLCAIAILLLTVDCVVRADDEAANRPVVRSSEYGAIYARSVPDESYGQKGKTKIFSVGRENDTVICEYDWYAGNIYIGGSGDATVIRFGPWHRGRKPQDDHLAIGIYRNGKVLKEYSTVEIQKMGSGVSGSVSHYQVFADRLGFRWVKGNDYVYEVKGVDGKVFTFDLNTGNIIEKGTEPTSAGDVLKAAPEK
jgi:hypothetical protein